jgi:BASS family bile acid:Na+ symporter
LLKHWLLFSLVITSGLAYLWPQFGLEVDPFRLPAWGLWSLVAATMFCLGLVVSREELVELQERPTSVGLGVAVQCTLMPALAWLAVRLLNLQGEIASGVILVGCVPGAMASNVLTMSARGNVSYSISLTTVATLLSPVTVPLVLYVIGGISTEAGAFDPFSTSRTLLLTVVLPVLTGYTFKNFLGEWKKFALILAPMVASISLLWIISSVVAGNRDRLGQIEVTMLCALLMVNLCGYAGGYLLGSVTKMPQAMLRALSLEVGMQNAGLGTALAATLFGVDSLAQIPTAAYTFGCMLTGTLLASWWSGVRGQESGGKE